jgi:hypothetical protein
VQCFLNITPIPFAKDGFVCVAVACISQAKNDAPVVKNLYVIPQDLETPKDADEWEDALGNVVL